MQNFHNESTDRLVSVLSKLSSPKECYAFLEDLCTIKEIQDMAQRFDTAILLSEGHSYQSIANEVGVSTATISRVKRCLEYGTGGYKTAIDIANGENENDNK